MSKSSVENRKVLLNFILQAGIFNVSRTLASTMSACISGPILKK